MASLGIYKETRIDLEPLGSNSVINIQLPSIGPFVRKTRTQRRITSKFPVCKTEEEFKNEYVATSSFIYSRRSSKYPRNFLCRCLKENTVLELRSVDLSKAEHEKRDASLVLRIGFSSAIRHGGVALADSPDQDVLSVFVLTKNNELYTLSLRPGFFCRPEASEDEIERWCKIFKPSSLTISAHHRLVACSSLELLVSLGDGRVMHLSRKVGEDGSHWEEAAYNDGQWGASLRGLIRWQGTTTVRYDGHVLDQSTAVTAHLSPDQKHIFAVCLNHTLKAWNMDTGKITFSRDLLGKQREPQEIPRLMLDPGMSRVMELFQANGASRGYQYFITTFSPQQSGVFKFWGVRDADHAETGLRDLFPDEILRVPDPDDGALWTMADFKLKTSKGSTEIEIWILLRLNRRYKLYHKKSDLEELAEKWEEDWATAVVDSSRQEPFSEPPRVFGCESQNISERWIDALLIPGRVLEPILETALSIYNSAQGSAPVYDSKTSLKERLGLCVGSHVQLDSSNSDTTKFREQVNKEWLSFWSIVKDLDQSRWEPLSLNYDATAGMPWITFSGGSSAIRECGDIERLAYNKPEDFRTNSSMLLELSIETDEETRPPQFDKLAVFVEAAVNFRASFSDTLRLRSRDALKQELWQDCLYSVPVRIQSFYDRCEFADEINDKQYNDLATDLKDIGGFEGLTTNFVFSLLNLFLQPMSTESSGLVSTKFGLKILVKGTQEVLDLHIEILTNVILLVVFIDAEVDPEDFSMDEFDISRIYTELLELLRRYQIIQWLATNVRLDPHHTKEVLLKDLSISRPVENSQVTCGNMTTILESLFAVDIRPQSYAARTQSETTTRNIEDLLKWVIGGNASSITLERVLVNIQCNLLKNNDVDLATSFLFFQPSTAWATYFHGRLCLLRSEFAEAASCFKKVAYNLCTLRLFKSNETLRFRTPTDPLLILARPYPGADYTLASSYLLDPLSASFLGTGLTNYYIHILSLFEPYHVPAQAVCFAHLALQFSASPKASTEAISDLLSRLFHASLLLPDFSTAFVALIRFSDAALQKNCLKRLVTDMVSAGYVNELLALPFAALKEDVDGILTENAKRETISSSEVSAVSGLPFYKILYAWRLQQSDMRGAAAVLVERLEHRKELATRKRGFNSDRQGNEVLEEYLVGINALGSVSEEGGWVLVGGDDVVHGGEKRKVIRLEDVRKDYQEELDRRSVIDSGRFGIVDGTTDDDMDFS
ncbi:hypothetical protein MMC19_007443 [Ptychographa xylographoides]|nr:hypothetical protein [Ptychographa xylographoides]